MRLCTFRVDSPLGKLTRVGVELADGRLLDANLAHATMLAGRDQHPRARQLADLLVPPDMLALVQTGRFGLEAIAEALAYFEQQGAPSQVEGASLIHETDTVEILAPLPQPVSILCGALDYQIEHHLFPKLPPNRYREIAPQVEAVCHAFDVEYRTDSWPRTMVKMMDWILELSFAEVSSREKARAVLGTML